MNGISTSVYLTKESIEKIDNVKGTKKMSTVINTVFANMSEDHLKSVIGKTHVYREPETIKDVSKEKPKYSKEAVRDAMKILDKLERISQE